MSQTCMVFVNLRKMDDEDGGYECVIGRHLYDGSYCRRRYFPSHASRKRLRTLGVTIYRGAIFYFSPTPPQEPTP